MHAPSPALDLPTSSASRRVVNCNLCHTTSRDLVFTKAGYDLVRCRNCGLLYVLNPPSASELETHYSFASGYHRELAEAVPTIAQHSEEARENLRLLTKHVQSGRLLDVGCSTGLFLCEARASGFDTRGLEFSADSARIAHAKYGLAVDHGELRPGTYQPDSFDVVTMWDVIEHVPDARTTLEAARELLAPDGVIILKTPNADGLYPRASLAVAHLINYWGHPEPPGHLYQFSVATLSRLVDITGFDLLHVYHRRIPIAYSFGTCRNWLRSPKWLVYCLAFAPVAILGPRVQRGDDITVVARKRS